MRASRLRAGLAVLLLTGSPAWASSASGPAVGDRAPAFSLRGSDGNTYTLDGLLAAHRGVVLAWFPRAFTGGCSAELESLVQSEKALSAYDVAFFMVSLDSPEQNRDFAESAGAGFVLLSDPEKTAAEPYGVLAPTRSHAQRWTYYIDASGVVKYVDRDVQAATHGQDVVEKLGELGFPKKP